MSSSLDILYASLGGIIPALIWLFFWLREDSLKPEPKGRLLLTFGFGMAAVLVSMKFEKLVWMDLPLFNFVTFTLWAIIEEGLKFVAAYFGAIRSRDDDEPLDPVIYMITAALGFVALENTLFLLGTLTNQDLIAVSQNVAATLATGGLRFLGASLLHVLSSATIGLALAASFYKSRGVKFLYVLLGFSVAVLIHSYFNLSIFDQEGYGILRIFGLVWAAIAVLLLLFERVKAIAPQDKSGI